MKLKKIFLIGSSVLVVILFYTSLNDIKHGVGGLERKTQHKLTRSERPKALKLQVKKLRQHSINNRKKLQVKRSFRELPLFESQLKDEVHRLRYFKSKCLASGQAFRLPDCIVQNNLHYRKRRVSQICSLQQSQGHIKADRLFVMQSR